MILMVFLAWSPIRRPFYDTFLQVHRVLAIVSVIGIWRHINSDGYYEIRIVVAVVAIWIAERMVRVLRLLYSKLVHHERLGPVFLAPANQPTILIMILPTRERSPEIFNSNS